MHGADAGTTIKAFNSLYEIPRFGFSRFGGVCVFQFSLWDSCNTCIVKEKSLKQNFQFSLWDSRDLKRLKHESIASTFNSLYEIQRHLQKNFLFHSFTCFQFSLWDSGVGCEHANTILMIFFQFSLWDSTTVFGTLFDRWIIFQFSLWDS